MLHVSRINFYLFIFFFNRNGVKDEIFYNFYKKKHFNKIYDNLTIQRQMFLFIFIFFFLIETTPRMQFLIIFIERKFLLKFMTICYMSQFLIIPILKKITVTFRQGENLQQNFDNFLRDSRVQDFYLSLFFKRKKNNFSK